FPCRPTSTAFSVEPLGRVSKRYVGVRRSRTHSRAPVPLIDWTSQDGVFCQGPRHPRLRRIDRCANPWPKRLPLRPKKRPERRRELRRKEREELLRLS